MATNQNPQLTPQELQKLVDLYKKVDGLTQSAAQNMANLANQQGNARAELDRLNDAWNDFVRNISYAEQQFAKLADKIKGQNTGISKAAASYDRLRGIAAKISDIQDGIKSTSAKELKSIQEKLDAELRRLETAKTQLETQKQNARSAGDFKAFRDAHLALQQINATLADQHNYIAGINDAITNENEHLRKVNEALGLTGTAMRGMSKIPFLGDLPGMKEAMEEINAEISEAIRDGKTISRAEALSMTFKKMGGVVKNALTDPLVGIAFIGKQLKEIFLKFDQQVGDIAKNMNITYEEATNVRTELGNIALTTNDISVSAKTLGESLMAVNSAFGVTADIGEENLVMFTKLRERAGLTNDEIINMNKISLATGESIEDAAEGFLGSAKALSIEKGLAINVKQLMKETANTSNAIRLSIGGTTKSLAEAAVKAKSFGMNLEQADKIAGSLLNFEDSISAELEAELLTGKQLNLETARYAALTGDLGTLTEEISKNIGSAADYQNMNRIQQEAIAKAVGMTREELANTLVEQEAINSLGRNLSDQEKEAYEFAKQKYGAEKAAKMLGEGQLEVMMHQQSVQERFNLAVEKLQETFANIMSGPLGSIAEMLGSLVENAGVLWTIFGAIATIITGKMVLGLGRTIAQLGIALGLSSARAIAEVTAAEALTLGVATIAIVGGVAAVAGLMSSLMSSSSSSVKKTGDGAVDPNGGLIIAKPEGDMAVPIVQGVPNDYAYLSTNSPNINKPQPTPAQPQFSQIKSPPPQNNKVDIDYDKLAAAMSKINITVALNNKSLTDEINKTNYTTAVQIQ